MAQLIAADSLPPGAIVATLGEIIRATGEAALGGDKKLSGGWQTQLGANEPQPVLLSGRVTDCHVERTVGCRCVGPASRFDGLSDG